MTTRAEFKTRLRGQLDDPDAVQWTDADLDRYLDESAGKYSRFFPRIRESEFVANGTDARYNVPDDLLDDAISRCWLVGSGGTREIPGNAIRPREDEPTFTVIDQEIVFNFVPGANTTVRIRYAAIWEIPTSGNTLIPKEDEGLITLWCEHLAWRKLGQADAALSRWDETGRRDDSPTKPIFLYLEQEYQRQINEKLSRGRFRSVLRRAPRVGRTVID